MAEKLALKRLAGSDLSFFEYHFRNKTFGDHRQKGINLNTDVFVDQFYPQAHANMGARWPVLVTIFGPGAAPAYAPPGDHRRPITYNNNKNWRLDGGTIPDDPALPDRFHPLAIGDLVLFRFRGDQAPTEVDVLLISAAVEPAIHAPLDAIVPKGRRTMVPVTAAQIETLLTGVAVPEGHALHDLEYDPEIEEAVEEVALGGAPAATLAKKRGGRRLTPAELAQAREEAQRIGADGEELLNSWLAAQEEAEEITDLDWASQRDAAAPYDFRFRHATDGQVKMDAKSTTGPFGRALHLSLGEALEAADAAARYDIARIHSIDEDGAKLRIAEGIGDFARSILAGITLPAGVRIDGFSIDPALLKWGDEIPLQRPADEEE